MQVDMSGLRYYLPESKSRNITSGENREGTIRFRSEIRTEVISKQLLATLSEMV